MSAATFRVHIRMAFAESRPEEGFCCDTAHRTVGKATRCGAETVRRMLPNTGHPADISGPISINTHVVTVAP